jgi:hypothetical protein
MDAVAHRDFDEVAGVRGVGERLRAQRSGQQWEEERQTERSIHGLER